VWAAEFDGVVHIAGGGGDELNVAYNMDCMEYMKTLPDKAFELAIVDPPYGGNDAIGMKDNSMFKSQAAKRTDYKQFINAEPPKEYWEQLFRVSKHQIVWGCNFYTKVNLSGGRIVWDKKGTAFGRAEEAYCSMTKSVNIFEYVWNGMLQENMRDKETRIHPTQKPVALYEWLLTHYAKPGDHILDTHLGSGSSRIAAYNLGFDFVGCEIDEDYFKAQEERYQAHIAQMNLFTEATP
jgi:site-specific DNA-methyltransferase (adenine-specific)